MEYTYFCCTKEIWQMEASHDLRKINESLQPMGPLQPGVPNPACGPKDWPLLIIDLRDCFFTIPLVEKDRERLAFSLPVRTGKHYAK